MKLFYFIIISTLIISSCSPKTKYFSDIKLSDNSIIVYDNGWSEPATKRSIRKLHSHNFVIIKNPSLYSKTFITSINPNILLWKCCLDSNKLIFLNHDTCLFPDNIPFGKNFNLTNKDKWGSEFTLTFKRTSLSSINYRFDIIEKDSSRHFFWKDNADLYPDFFISPEIDTDDSTGLAYKILLFHDKYVRIRVGEDPIDGKSLWGKIEYQIGSFGLDLKYCPTLIENSNNNGSP